LNGWTDLLPEYLRDTAYSEDYSDRYDLSYTPYNSDNTEIWFVDSYGRTNATEDRATIFQNLYSSFETGAIDSRIDYDNLKLKSRYYSVMLRNNFDCLKDADTLPWEKYIGTIDMNEFTVK
jgi:hypothetical protein